MGEATDAETPCCLVCRSSVEETCKVEFSKSCEDKIGARLSPTGKLISYVTCSACGHVFAPEMVSWTSRRLINEVYNQDYVLVDPEFTGARALRNARMVYSMFEKQIKQARHLDYGGGEGKMSERLIQLGWDSVCFDPFSERNAAPVVGRFDLITAFEVLEHAQNPHALMDHIDDLLKDDAVLLASTILTDEFLLELEAGNWWYLAPRNGHISLFSRLSLQRLATSHGLKMLSIADGLHIMARDSGMDRWSFLFETQINPWDLAIE